MAFGNEDPIDKKHREIIRELETRNLHLALALGKLLNAFERSTSMTQAEKEELIKELRKVLTS